MNYLTVGTTNVKASQMVLGCMRMASLTAKEASTVVSQSIESGVNLFDHADIYGGGDSEIRFSQAVKEAGIGRDQMLLQSKAGIRKGQFDFSKKHLLASVDGILERLETDYLDFFLLHRPDALVEPEEVAEAFDQLHKSGKVLHFGVSNHNPMQIEFLQKYVPMKLVANQLQFGPAHTSMIDAGLNVNMQDKAGINRDGAILDYCRLNDITIQAWSPYQVDLDQGLFIKHPDYVELTETLTRIAATHQVTLEALVMAWIIRHPANMQPIIGSMNPQRISQIALGSEIKLTREEWYEIYLSAGNRLP